MPSFKDIAVLMGTSPQRAVSLLFASALICAIGLPYAAGAQPAPPPGTGRELKGLRPLKLPSKTRLKGLRKHKKKAAPALTKRPQVKARPKPTPPKPEEIPSFTSTGKTSNARCVPVGPRALVTFNFKGTVRELITAISKATCKNFIIAGKGTNSKKKLEILSPTPISGAAAWQAFLSALAANDQTVVRTGRYYKVIKSAESTRSPVAMYRNGQRPPISDAMVTVIWKLQYAGDISRVVNYLNIFKSTKGQIHPFPATNTIIATDYASSINRLRKILEQVDRPGALEQVRILTVEFATATDIAKTLTQIFEPKQNKNKSSSKAIRVKGKKLPKIKIPDSGGGGGGGAVAVSKIIADDRTNKLIIIASDAAFFQIQELLRELDVPEDGDGMIHVVRLRHADAEKLSTTLASLAQGSSRSNNKRRGKNAGGAAQLFQGEVKVTAEKTTNSLVITASKSDLASMKRVIEKLDVPRFQVFVEAVILEVSINDDRTLGTGWHGGVSPTIGGDNVPILFGSTPNSELSSLSALGMASLLGLAAGATGPTLAGTEDLITGGIPSMGIVLNALQSTNNVNVVSTPHLLTMDNEAAEIQVNEKRPFPSGLSLGNVTSALSSASSSATSSLGALSGLGLGSVSFNREDVGLTLKLKPQINDEDHVRLEIDQSLSDVAGTDQVTGQVITSNRAAKTTVVVRSQDSVVIGGLVRERETVGESKIPLLGDIPLLGWLFKRQNRVKEKVNLLLIITPYIIRGPADFQRIFERKMAERKEFVDRYYGATPEYRASINWDQKTGPLARYRAGVRHELMRAENGGPGLADQDVIRANQPPAPGPKGFDPQPPPPGGPSTPDATPATDAEGGS